MSANGDVDIREWWDLVKRPPHWVMSDRVVNVKVSSALHNDLEGLNKVTLDVLDRLGCPGCHSGYDIRFDVLRDFAVGPDLEVFPVERGFGR